MGYVPYVPKLPMYEWDEATLRHEMRHRDSRFASRRRRAYAACLELIRRAEDELGYTRERSNELLRGMHSAFDDFAFSLYREDDREDELLSQMQREFAKPLILITPTYSLGHHFQVFGDPDPQ